MAITKEMLARIGYFGINQLSKIDDPIEQAVACLWYGVTWDGSHHKQWFMEKALEALGCNLKLLKEMDDDNWEPGIAP